LRQNSGGPRCAGRSIGQLRNDARASLLRQVLEEQGGAVDEVTKSLIATMEPTRPNIHATIVERNVARLQELLEEDAALSNLSFQGDAPIEVVTNALIQAAQNEGESVEDDDGVLLRILELLLKHGGNANGSESSSAATLVDPGEDKEVPLHKLVLALRECINNQQQEASEEASASSPAARLEAAIDLLVQFGASVTPKTAQLLHLTARRVVVATATAARRSAALRCEHWRSAKSARPTLLFRQQPVAATKARGGPVGLKGQDGGRHDRRADAARAGPR